MTKYKVKDSFGNIVKIFPVYTQASNYMAVFGNRGWYIEYASNNI